VSITAFGLGVLFYKMLETKEELAFLGDRVGFSYLRVVVKKHDLVLALVIACNKERTGNVSVNKFE